ncbi:MAG: Ldh family oxidoreductase [Candidatus Bathyarchaeota archaeon]|nr:Ldh family oxidoreductase [Candidatus Bathyarchaeota archaeon]
MADNVVWVNFDTLERFMVDVFKEQGVPEEDAKVCADVLITSDKRGIDSHGVNRLKPVYYDRLKKGIQNPVTDFEIVREGPTTAVVDGHNGMGHLVAKKAMDLCIEKARRYGMGMVAVRESTHYGIAGYYALMAAEAGMIGITGTNARPSVAPTFGAENMYGTNPLTVGLPTDEKFPFIYDAATSITQRGKIEVAARKGEKIPEGLLIDNQGEYLTDPKEALARLIEGKAALLPIGGKGEETGGYKGYGFATIVEILSAALQGGAFLKAITGVNLGHFFIAVDIEAFTELESFKKTAGDILRELRASRKMPGQDRIYTAGEKEYLVWLERKNKGVPLGKSLQKELIQMRDELGLTQYRFGFES